jgi:hypothetical protein
MWPAAKINSPARLAGAILDPNRSARCTSVFEQNKDEECRFRSIVETEAQIA